MDGSRFARSPQYHPMSSPASIWAFSASPSVWLSQLRSGAVLLPALSSRGVGRRMVPAIVSRPAPERPTNRLYASSSLQHSSASIPSLLTGPLSSPTSGSPRRTEPPPTAKRSRSRPVLELQLPLGWPHLHASAIALLVLEREQLRELLRATLGRGPQRHIRLSRNQANASSAGIGLPPATVRPSATRSQMGSSQLRSFSSGGGAKPSSGYRMAIVPSRRCEYRWKSGRGRR